MNTRHGFQIGTIRGIPIRIHYTFLIVLPFLAYVFGQNFVGAARLAGVSADRLSGPPWLWGLFVALVLFGSVLIHELAHSLYALAHGGKVQSITLLMLGFIVGGPEYRLTVVPPPLRCRMSGGVFRRTCGWRS